MSQHDPHPLFARLRAMSQRGPIAVAHRGDSRHYPENTLPAFAAAVNLGAPMQEFDVQVTADGTLVCLHDETLDRTTDAARRLGPGARILDVTAAGLADLDAGSWKGGEHRGARVPTLAEALATMLPKSIPMIEHKAGTADAFVAELERLGLMREVVLQSFDWAFVRAVAARTNTIALALLGPTTAQPAIDEEAVMTAKAIGAGMLHWHAPELTADQIALVRHHGLLLCTYTSDDELSWHGGRTLGIHAMCTNDPGRMLRSLRDRAH